MDFGGPKIKYDFKIITKPEDYPDYKPGECLGGDIKKIIHFYNYKDKNELSKLKSQYEEIEILNEHECICCDYEQKIFIFKRWGEGLSDGNKKMVYPIYTTLEPIVKKHLNKSELKKID